MVRLQTGMAVVVLMALTLFSPQFIAGEEAPAVERSSFPKGFVFGTASAAYQYEGAAHEGGRGPSIWDKFSHEVGKVKGNSTGDVAVDQYHRYKEDVWLLKDLNMDAYRFSISWSRVFPQGVGEVNWEGVKYYDNLIAELLERGIEPYVTLYHWDMPQALEDSIGGWLSPEIVDPFARYARFCFQRWGKVVKHWITFNEIYSFSQGGYKTGEKAPGRCSPPDCVTGNSSVEPYLVSHHALLSHAKVVDIYRKEFKQEQDGVIGITTDSAWFLPLDANSRTDVQSAQEAIDENLGMYLDPIFFGEYPRSMRARHGSNLPLAEQLKDPERIRYYHDYMQNVLLAIKDGSDVRGYFAWSLLDNFEWAVGYTVRFGIYYVDYNNGLARFPKDSVYWFQRILKKRSH